MTAASLPSNVFLVHDENEFYLYDADLATVDVGEALLGGIVIQPDPDGGWHVDLVWANHGYGPMLYRLAIEHATRNGHGLKPNDGGVTSDEAQRVWDKFQGSDVRWAGPFSRYATLRTNDLEQLKARSQRLLANFDVDELLDVGFDNIAQGAQE